MTSLRAKILIQAIKRGGLLSTVIDSDNLDKKRKQFKKLEKIFPVPLWAKVRGVQDNDFKGEWVTAPNSQDDTVLLYIHGGGFVFDGTKLYRGLIARLARATNSKVLSINYSLAPEHPYPTALNEATAAYKWLLSQGYDASKISIGGDSAGGTLALSLLHIIKRQNLDMPACAFVMSPATDATLKDFSVENKDKDFYINFESLKFFIKAYFGNTSTSDPIASPLLGSLEGLPPLLIHVDKKEIMYKDSLRFAEKARKSGVEVELYESNDLFHVWHIFAGYIPEAKKSIDEIGKFVKAHII